MDLGEVIEEWGECVPALAGLDDVWFHHLFGGCCEDK